jgi:hypothetical protein
MGNGWMIVPILPIIVGIGLAVVLAGILITAVASLPQQGTTSTPFTSTPTLSPAIAGILSLYASAIIALFAVYLVGAFAIYYLIDRRNRHFRRQQRLFSSISAYLSTRSPEGGPRANISRLAELHDDSLFEEQERPAGVWALLYVVVSSVAPIVGLVVAYNLTQDLRKHEQRQSDYQQTLSLALDDAGIRRAPFGSYRSHNKDPIVYVILTAVTAGLFWVYWFYTLLNDYNEHFADQAMFEDQLLSILKPSTKCTNCGGAIPQEARFCPLCGTPQPSKAEYSGRPI